MLQYIRIPAWLIGLIAGVWLAEFLYDKGVIPGKSVIDPFVSNTIQLCIGAVLGSRAGFYAFWRE